MKKLLISCAICTLSLVTVSIAADPIAYFPLDGDFIDAMGNAAEGVADPGTHNNASKNSPEPAPGFVTGIAGLACEFTGNECAYFSDLNALFNSGDF